MNVQSTPETNERLGFLDQFALWASLAVTLTIPAAAVFVVNPLGDAPLGVPAIVTAIVLGTTLGSLLLAGVAAAGQRTGLPTMRMMRGVLGARTSYLPTVLNIVQCFGWAAIEVLIMTEVATALTSASLRPVWALVSGVIALVMALRPLPSIKIVRKYLTAAVVIATVVLIVGMLREGLDLPASSNWHGFWPAFDIVFSLPISWAPLVADYSRFARTKRDAFWGVFLGYASAGIVYFLMGLLAVLTISGAAEAFTATDFIPGMLAVPVGVVALVILLIDEVDEAFANIYSTGVSVENLTQRIDRRVTAVIVAGVAIALALTLDLLAYESFLFAIGAVFVPLTGVVLTWFFATRGEAAPTGTPWLAVPWGMGLVTYQLLAPGFAPGWSALWSSAREALGITTVTTSASLPALVVAVVGTLVIAHMRKAIR